MNGRRFLLSVLILAAAISLALGVSLPIIKLTKLYVWTNEHSVASITWALYRNEEYVLAIIIGTFSIVFPIVKLVYLLAAAFIEPGRSAGAEAFLHRLEWLGKWSMLDVLALALAIFYAKTSDIADAATLPGLYFFVGAVVLTMLAHAWIKARP